MQLSETILDNLKKGLGISDLQIPLLKKEESWSINQYRNKIRSKLKSEIDGLIYSKKLPPQETIELLDLNCIPELTQASVSISHCPDFGGFALTTDNVTIGFDIERVDRIQKKIVERISTAEEVMDSFDYRSLFVAKESTFKALRHHTSVTVLSQITVNTWNYIEKGVSQFHLKSSPLFHSETISGVVLHCEQHILSVTCISL